MADIQPVTDRELTEAYALPATRVDRFIVSMTTHQEQRNIRIAFLETNSKGEPSGRAAISMMVADAEQLHGLLASMIGQVEADESKKH